MARFKASKFILFLATLSATAFGQSGNSARPGTLNYVEGQASIEGRQLSPQSAGNTTLEAGPANYLDRLGVYRLVDFGRCRDLKGLPATTHWYKMGVLRIMA